MRKEYLTDITNALVIGSGGAGLRAAIEAKLQGLSVRVFGKRLKNDVNTVLAAGGINVLGYFLGSIKIFKRKGKPLNF